MEQELPEDYPYNLEVELTIRSHEPPAPFGERYVEEAAPRPLEHSNNPPREENTPLGWALSFPPTETPPVVDPEVQKIKILKRVAVGPNRRSQILLCMPSDGLRCIVKIYDALYTPSATNDVSWETDRAYSQEAAAYTAISESEIDGEYTPEYRGAWTFDLPVPGRDRTRPVRMIMLEYMPGLSIEQISDIGIKHFFTPESRLRILADIYEAWARLEHIGVRTYNLTPENVILACFRLPEGEMFGYPDIILVDFTSSSVATLEDCLDPMFDDFLPVDPTFYLGMQCPRAWLSWVPEPHRSRPEVWRGWSFDVWPDRLETYTAEPVADTHGWYNGGGPEQRVWQEPQERALTNQDRNSMMYYMSQLREEPPVYPQV